MTKDYEEKIRAAVEKVAAAVAGGSIRTLAHMLGVSSQAIYKWIKEGVPVKRALEMSLMTRGQVQWHELVPEVLDDLRQSIAKMGVQL
jgi:DNA-binding transcriptional regulator YdaS (Cro superfamily)